jgi:aryl-alcohol dehydrogenase-like predicted oxidoreductase
MGMSGIYGASDDAESIATIGRAIDLGVNFLDTSSSYGSGGNQRLIGKAIAGRRDDVVIHSKFGSRRDADGKTLGGGADPDTVRRDCDDSLANFGVDVIDIFCPSRPDPKVDIEDTVGAMAELVAAGKVRALGLSEVGVERLRRAHAVHPIATLQMEYSLWSRDAEAEHLAACRELGIALIAYSPLGRGFLAGMFHEVKDIPEGDRRHGMPRFKPGNIEHNVALLTHIEEIARAKGATVAQIALAWLLAQGGDIVPIPGAKSRAHLEENVGAVDIELTAEDIAALDSALAPGAAKGTRYAEARMGRLNI